MLKQRQWRVVGAVTLGTCLAMGIYGRNLNALDSLRFFGIYWAVFSALLVFTLWIALVDFRHVLRQYREEKREVFLDTIGNEDFRKLLRESHDSAQPDEKKDTPR